MSEESSVDGSFPAGLLSCCVSLNISSNANASFFLLFVSVFPRMHCYVSEERQRLCVRNIER